MTAQKDEQVTKRVDFVSKDTDEQVATGIVMVPNAVDRQGDWERPETIARFAEQFEAFEEAGQADGGVMHAVWPSEHISLDANDVLDEDTEIGDETAPEGAWVQSWRFEDDELWGLVDDGILEGYSIGAVSVSWGEPTSVADLPDEVRVPDDVPDDELAWELTDGIVREVSAVDIPAVPDAMILETKADAEKRLSDYLGNRDGFIEEALQRGHTESEAERLWDYLSSAAELDGAGEPGKQSLLARAGKAALSVLTGGQSDAATSKATDDGTPSPEETKEGRTLSKRNRDNLFATIDAAADVLEDAGVDHGITRFTDRDDVGFDLSEHTAREWPKPDDEGEDGEDEDDEGEEDSNPTDAVPDSMTESAAGGETPDVDTTMSDDPMADAPEWAKAIHEQTEENSKRIDEALDGEEKADDPFEDAPEWAKSLQEQTAKNAERIDAISKQTGTGSQQLGGAEKGGDDTGELGDRQKFFVPESKRRAVGGGR